MQLDSLIWRTNVPPFFALDISLQFPFPSLYGLFWMVHSEAPVLSYAIPQFLPHKPRHTAYHIYFEPRSRLRLQEPFLTPSSGLVAAFQNSLIQFNKLSFYNDLTTTKISDGKPPSHSTYIINFPKILVWRLGNLHNMARSDWFNHFINGLQKHRKYIYDICDIYIYVCISFWISLLQMGRLLVRNLANVIRILQVT